MTQSVNTLNVEQFRGTTFFTLTPHKWGNRAKVKNPDKFAEYLEQMKREAAEKKAEGAKATTGAASVDGATLNGADVSKAAASSTKRLLVSPKLEALCQYVDSVKAAVCGVFGVATQSRVLKGLYVVRNELIEDINRQIEEAQERLTESWIDPKTGDTCPGYVEDFLATYEQDIEKTRTLPLLEGGLGPLFDRADYPTAEELRRRFALDVSWLALGIPEDLPPALKEKAAAKYEAQLAEAAEECKDALRVSLGSFLDRLVERLEPTQDGKPKVFRDSLIENVREFCRVFDARNFLNDNTLADLVGKCRTVLSDERLTPDNVRKYQDVRENTRAQFAKIQAELNAAIETRRGRAFDFAD